MKVCHTYDIFGQKDRDFVVVFFVRWVGSARFG